MLVWTGVSSGDDEFRIYYKWSTDRIRWWIIYKRWEKERNQEWVFELNTWIDSGNIILENTIGETIDMWLNLYMWGGGSEYVCVCVEIMTPLLLTIQKRWCSLSRNVCDNSLYYIFRKKYCTIAGLLSSVTEFISAQNVSSFKLATWK